MGICTSETWIVHLIQGGKGLNKREEEMKSLNPPAPIWTRSVALYFVCCKYWQPDRKSGTQEVKQLWQVALEDWK